MAQCVSFKVLTVLMNCHTYTNYYIHLFLKCLEFGALIMDSTVAGSLITQVNLLNSQTFSKDCLTSIVQLLKL